MVRAGIPALPVLWPRHRRCQAVQTAAMHCISCAPAVRCSAISYCLLRFRLCAMRRDLLLALLLHLLHPTPLPKLPAVCSSEARLCQRCECSPTYIASLPLVRTYRVWRYACRAGRWLCTAASRTDPRDSALRRVGRWMVSIATKAPKLPPPSQWTLRVYGTPSSFKGELEIMPDPSK